MDIQASRRKGRRIWSVLTGAVILVAPLGCQTSQPWQQPEGCAHQNDPQIFQEIAASLHHRDDDAGQGLSQQERSRHGHKGHGINAEAPGQEVISCHREPDDDGKGARPPKPRRHAQIPGEQCDCAEKKPKRATPSSARRSRRSVTNSGTRSPRCLAGFT